MDAVYNKADALGELGKYEEAIVWTEKALALEPANQNDSNSSLLTSKRMKVYQSYIQHARQMNTYIPY